MKLTIQINLDNEECIVPELAIPRYLDQISRQIADNGQKAGRVIDGNGNTIGKYLLSGRHTM